MSRTTVKTLVVDDNEGDAHLTIERLNANNQVAFEVVRVGTLNDAFTWLRNHRCDVVLLDLNLPDSDGVDTVRRLTADHPSSPAVVVSGLSGDALRRNALAAGAAEVLSKDDLSSPLFALSVLYVVERRRALEQERRLAQILDTTPDAIVVVGRTGELKYVNSQALTLFGRGQEELRKERLTFSAPAGTPVELRVVRPSDERVGELRVAELDWDGEAVSLAAIRDITQQRNLEMQLLMSDRLASLGTLAAGVAHEINNPLAVVLANIGSALQDLQHASPDTLEALGDAKDAAERIRNIVRDLKVFARTEEQLRASFDVHRIIESVLRMARNEVNARARLTRDYGELKPVLVNEARLSQVFLNLLVNAAQAIPEGHVGSNEIKIVTRQPTPQQVVVEFRDTGPGIPLDVQKRLFTPFFTTKPVGVGTGLGLAISQRITRDMGGEISFESEVGKGTCFRVTLPVAVDEADDAAAPTPLRVLKGGAPVRKRIMVIDDEPAILSLLRRSFGKAHDFVGHERAKAALERIQRGERFDIIFSDLMMPEMSGMVFCDEVERIDRLQAERIVLMTGGAFTPQSRDLVSASRYRTVEKPFDVAAMQALIEHAEHFPTPRRHT